MAWRAAVRIDLNEAERNELEARARRRKTARADAMRAQIVLLSAEGLSNVAIAERLNITRLTVATWRRRFRSYVSAATKSGLQDTSGMRSITPSFQEDTGYGRTACRCRFEGQAG